MRADFLNAFRALRSAPSFTAVALVVLTLGIGASTAIFSVVDGVVLRNVPFVEPDRLMHVADIDLRPDGFVGGTTTPQDYLDWAAQQTQFEGLAAVAGTGFTVRNDGIPERLQASQVTANLFSLLRVQPQVGGAFTAGHEVDGNHRVAVISHRLWQRRFGGAADVVGKTLRFDNGTYEVLGVMPEDFEYPVGATRPSELWVPYVVPASLKQRGNSRNYNLTVVGRLKPGATVAQAQQEMTAIQQRIQQEFPKWNPQREIRVRTLHESLVGRVRGWLLMLLGAVAFVMVLACVNVANLYLARATARVRDVGIRSALGASRWQLIRGFLVESLVLSLIGTALGVIAAYWGIALLKAALPANLPRAQDIGLDLRVLVAAAGAAVATGLFCGLAPAFQLTRPNLTGALRDGRGNTVGGLRQRLRSALVAAEVALAVVLLVGAGLFVSSFLRLTSINVGIDYRNVLTVPVYPPFVFSDPAQREAGMARAEQLVPQAIERVRAVAGVVNVGGIANGLPLSGSWSRTSVSVPGSDKKFEGDGDSVDTRAVSSSYFDVMGIPLLAGRLLEEADRTGARVIVLNDVAAKRYLGDRNPIGAQITINGERTVVGVVGSVRLGGPESEVRPEAYSPFEPKSMFGADLVVKTAGDPAAVAPAVFAALREIAPDLVLGETQTLEGFYGRLIAQRRFNMLLLSIFGVLGIVITGVGIYGVMAFVVEQRTQEIGVRMALGAQPRRVLGMMLSKAMVYVSAGLVVGLAGAYALSRYVKTFLFQVEPGDLRVYLATGALLVAIGLLAAWIPSRRASKVDPIIALRT